MKLIRVGEQDAGYAGDAPEIMQLVFQQSKSYIFLVVPQLQFCRQSFGYFSGSSDDWYAQCKLCRRWEIPRGAVFLEVVETPADVSTTGVPDRFALARQDSGYMYLRQSFGGLAEFRLFSTCWWYSDPEVYVLLSTCSRSSVH